MASQPDDRDDVALAFVPVVPDAGKGIGLDTYLHSMEESFFIPVTYKGKDLQFEASLQRRGYVHIIAVDVYGTMVTFERDEEGNWRALLPPEEQGKTPDVALLRTIGETIEALLK
jgi:hypothetical protein